MFYYEIKGGDSMKKYIVMGLVILFTFAVVGVKGPSYMDILELALAQPLIF